MTSPKSVFEHIQVNRRALESVTWGQLGETEEQTSADAAELWRGGVPADRRVPRNKHLESQQTLILSAAFY